MIHDGVLELDDGLSVVDDGHQQWHARQEQTLALPYDDGVPTRLIGQDAPGAHQLAPVTKLLFAPSGNNPGQPFDQALPRDYQRLECRILAIGGAIAICPSKEVAQAVWNQTLQAGAGAGLPIAATPVVAQATAAAAGNATATLPLLASITGFSITPGTAAAGYTAAITVNGASGGSNPINYALQGSATVAQPLNITFPSPLAPAAAATAISVTFTGNANTPSADIIVYGTLAGSPAYPPFNGPGAWVPAGTERTMRTGDEVWIALGSPSNAAASIIAVRRLGVEPPTLTRP